MVLKVTRRNLIKTGAAVGALTAASSLFVGRMSTIRAVGAPKPDLQLTPVEEWVPTTCWIGKQDCGMLARKIDGRVVKFEGHPANPRNQGTLCPKGQGQIAALYDPNRVKTPLVRTNAKGVQGEFRSATWDEALGMVADKMNEVRERDPRLLIWQKGRSKAKNFYDTAFVKASGATKLHHGAFCSDAGYRALEYTIGTHAVLHPDFKHTNYLLAWGWNITAAGGNKTCWLTWNQQLDDAKKRGIKVVSIDPRARPAGPFADEWVPIRPGTDLALALALCNLMIQSGTIDEPYLKQFTNSGYLVSADGTYLRAGEGDEAKEQVWDLATGKAVDAGSASDPALVGEFTIDGRKVKPAFQLFKEHVADNTAQWAAEKCGIDAKQILQIAQDLRDNVNIGATHVVDGIEIPYRPVAIMTYHIAQTELGFQQCRAQTMLMMLLGAMGAVGGQLSDYTWKIHKNYEGLDNISITDEPNIYLNKSKFYPINSNNSSIVAQVMQDPASYGVDYTPEVCIIHMANPMTSFLSQKDIYDGYMKFKFVAVIDPWLSHTADLFADVVLPAATLEKYEGPISATDQYIGAQTLRVPPMDPLFESRGDIQIYLDLCEKAGILTGEGGYLDEVNKALKIDDANKMPISTKPSGEREIFDRWAKSAGYENGVEFFETESVDVTGPVSAKSRYGYAMDEPFGGAIHRLYGESLLGYQNQMKALGVEEIYWQDYTAFPTWREMTMNSSPAEYDMHLISYHMIEFKQSRTSMISVLKELAPKQRADINPATAKKKGFADGDEVIVESHNAVTGETRTITVPLHFTEALRPDTLAIPHHYGEIARHPATKGEGDTPNALFFTGKGYTANTADQSFHVKVRLQKA